MLNIEWKPITSQQEHQTCLEKLEALMSLEQLTQEQEQQLSALVAVVEKYENRHFPLHPTDAVWEVQCG